MNPNQKTIIISKFDISREVVSSCAKRLEAGAFKLWVYLSYCQEGELQISNTLLKQDFGMTRAQYDKAIHQLIDLCFLAKIKNNVYDFVPLGDDTIQPSILANAYVYGIKEQEQYLYIGKTYRDIPTRINEHRTKGDNIQLREALNSNREIEVVTLYESHNQITKEQLFEIEHNYTLELEPLYNIKV